MLTRGTAGVNVCRQVRADSDDHAGRPDPSSLSNAFVITSARYQSPPRPLPVHQLQNALGNHGLGAMVQGCRDHGPIAACAGGSCGMSSPDVVPPIVNEVVNSGGGCG
jgi:hypothetical protein